MRRKTFEPASLPSHHDHLIRLDRDGTDKVETAGEVEKNRAFVAKSCVELASEEGEARLKPLQRRAGQPSDNIAKTSGSRPASRSLRLRGKRPEIDHAKLLRRTNAITSLGSNIFVK